jgi:hypothetical protein
MYLRAGECVGVHTGQLAVTGLEGRPLGIAWRNSHEVLADLLRQHGQDPTRVGSADVAWQAFREFLALPVDGLEPDREDERDAFGVQWGRYSWNDGLPSLSFTRLYAVDVHATWTEPDWYQPEYWRVDLVLIFADAPALADLDQLNVQNSGFDSSPPGPEQDNAFREVEWEIQHYPTLQALWASTPLRSNVQLDRAH